MKTCLFFAILSPCLALAAPVVLTNLSSSPVLFLLDGDYYAVGATSTLSLDLADYPLAVSVGVSSMVTPAVQWPDHLYIAALTPDTFTHRVIASWSWFQVLEKLFWVICAYAAARLALVAVSTLWRNPEP